MARLHRRPGVPAGTAARAGRVGDRRGEGVLDELVPDRDHLDDRQLAEL
ncbi:hypothetical protein LRP67_00110 [Nocardioides sp. cx-169]|nr:hypothetical protein [Nocardioides sp. cx-169]MCD4532494.1 hypothetical protein [Nocardioides sp. cx-169]